MINSHKSPKGASSQTVNAKLITKKLKPTLKSPSNKHRAHQFIQPLMMRADSDKPKDHYDSSPSTALIPPDPFQDSNTIISSAFTTH